MRQKLIQIDSRDNAAVALDALSPGEEAVLAGRTSRCGRISPLDIKWPWRTWLQGPWW